MSTSRRRLSGSLGRHAAAVMPPRHQHWADAMQNELAYIADDREALRWALGALGTAYAARLRGLYLLDVPGVRGVGVVLVAFRAFDMMLPTLLTIAYRAGAFGTAARLGQMTPGDDYHRLIPLMEAIPAWVHALSLVGGACYLLAIAQLLGRQRAAHVALLAAVSVELVLTMFGRVLVAEVGVAAAPDPSFLAAVVLPFVLPLLLAFAAWSGSRSRRPHRESSDPA